MSPAPLPCDPESVKARLLERMVVTPSGCWEWTRSRCTSGYGHLRVDGRMQVAHKVAYELFVGAVPEGLFLDHVCHNEDLTCAGGDSCSHRRCINPAHLEPVTTRENVLRGQGPAGKQARQTHCKRGHPLSGGNLYLYPDGRRRACRTCRGLLPREQVAA